MHASLVRTTAFAAAAILVLGAALTFERPSPAAVGVTASSSADASPSPTPEVLAPTSSPSASASPAVRWGDDDVPATPVVIDDPASEADPDEQAIAPAPSPAPAAGPAAGEWLVAPGTSDEVGRGASLRRFTVEVEGATGLDPAVTAAAVEDVLFDPRSWVATGRFRFQRIDEPAVAEVRVVIATPATVDRWCATVGLNTGGWLSCQVHRRAMLNVDRWRTGVPAFGDDLEGYRAYLVNHEVGHVLGYRHVDCPAEGALAPVMMQQSKSVGACRANGWVDPDAADG